jgi:hypothetical protein
LAGWRSGWRFSPRRANLCPRHEPHYPCQGSCLSLPEWVSFPALQPLQPSCGWISYPLPDALIGTGTSPPTDALWSLGEDLHRTGRRDFQLFLVRALANRGFGPAAFACGEMYDPLRWSAGASPFSKPRADKAQERYEKALALGVPEAAARLEALKSAGPVR